jgi:peptidoglycan/xylan/chitin deacetylase (PgdA/CDA1 family)
MRLQAASAAAGLQIIQGMQSWIYQGKTCFMRFFSTAMLACLVFIPGTAVADTCKTNKSAIGTSRIMEIDTQKLHKVGTRHYQPLELDDREVVLTFDDGPVSKNTSLVLSALRKHCVKATFFPVGMQVEHYPDVLREIRNDGHTIGSHTWSHPHHMGRISFERGKQEIQAGFAAIAEKLGEPASTFFRFPGFHSSEKMEKFAKKHAYTLFSVDVDSDDWRGIKANEIVRRIMARLKQKKKGIILFHDTKIQTAKALPSLFRQMKAEGYKIVHITSKQRVAPDAKVIAQLKRSIAVDRNMRRLARAGKRTAAKHRTGRNLRRKLASGSSSKRAHKSTQKWSMYERTQMFSHLSVVR